MRTEQQSARAEALAQWVADELKNSRPCGACLFTLGHHPACMMSEDNGR